MKLGCPYEILRLMTNLRVQIGFPFIIIVFLTSSPKPWMLVKYPGKREGTGILILYSKKQIIIIIIIML